MNNLDFVYFTVIPFLIDSNRKMNRTQDREEIRHDRR